MQFKFVTILFISLVIIFSSCKKKEKYYNGDNMANYPDVELIWKENFEHFDRGITTYTLINIENNKTDTSFLHPDNIDWNEWKLPLISTNIRKKEFDKQYRINMFNDTISNSMTVLYSSINPTNPTKSLSIVSSTIDNSITSIYVDYIDAGFFSSTTYKLLYINGISIQIQESIKRPFSKLQKRIRTIYFNQ